MKNRTRGYYRYQRKRNIKRKYDIREAKWGMDMVREYYSERAVGELSKGKIHCSCPLCREKSYDQLSHGDRKAVLGMMEQLKEFYIG